MIVYCPICKTDFESPSVNSIHDCATGKVLSMANKLQIALNQAGSLRKLSATIRIPKSTLHAWLTGKRVAGELVQGAVMERLRLAYPGKGE